MNGARAEVGRRGTNRPRQRKRTERHTQSGMVLQAERLLEAIEMLGQQYTDLNEPDEQEAAEALAQCATALSRVVADTR